MERDRIDFVRGLLGLPPATNEELLHGAEAVYADVAQAFYLDADAVIAELRQLIPSPVELAERKKQKRK